jgi:hypothetical protein
MLQKRQHGVPCDPVHSNGQTMMRDFRSAAKTPVQLTRRSIRSLWEVQNRERLRLWSEMSQVRGLMQLLMKQRNGYRWSDADRREIRLQLRKLAALSPYMVLFVSPGGFIALPVLAWWLDRRRQKRISAPTQPSTD